MKDLIAAYLFNDQMKAKVIKELNENINIPIIGEGTEDGRLHRPCKAQRHAG